MIAKLVAAAVRAPLIVAVLVLALIGIGLHSYKVLAIEAYPNPVAPMIEIIAQPQGWSAEEVERYVSLPLETGLVGMPGLEHIRSQSLFGLSDVKCYFGWDTSYAMAQQRVLNQLNFVTLPPGVSPELSPWSAIGELYRYKVVGKGYSLADLKTVQDWILEKQFRQVPGVIDVVGFGGLTKQYHVEVDPYRLRGRGVALSQLQTAIANANQNVGGQRITLGDQSFDVRGVGLIRSVQDIGDITVSAAKGVPVRVRDVAAVSVGAAPRLGIVGHDDEPDVVEGIVLMRYGGDSLKTIRGIHDRVDYIHQNRVLPPGHRHRTRLRPRRPGQADHAHGDGESPGRHDSRFHRALPVSRQRSCCAHHRHQHSARPAFRVLWHGVERNRRQPDFPGCRGFRHRRRFDGHRDGEHFRQLHPQGWQRVRTRGRGGARSRATHVRVHPDYRRGLHSALHPDRGGGRHHVAHGAHLCLRHRRRHPACPHLHAHAGLAGADHAQRRARGKGKRRHALPQSDLPPCVCVSRCVGRNWPSSSVSCRS